MIGCAEILAKIMMSINDLKHLMNERYKKFMGLLAQKLEADTNKR